MVKPNRLNYVKRVRRIEKQPIVLPEKKENKK